MFDKFNDMHFMDILQKCDILDVIKQKQHFVTVFFTWACARYGHLHDDSTTPHVWGNSLPPCRQCLPTYLLFDAKSQLLQSPEPTPVKLDILNSWLAAVSCGRLWCLADGIPDFLDFVTISRHHWWPTGSPLILFTHCPLFLKVMYNTRNGIIVWRFWGITAVLSPKTAFHRNERSRFVPKLYYFYFFLCRQNHCR